MGWGWREGCERWWWCQSEMLPGQECMCVCVCVCERWVPMWGWYASLGDSRGASVGAQPDGGQQQEAQLGIPAFLVSFSLCQDSGVSVVKTLSLSSSSPPRLFPFSIPPPSVLAHPSLHIFLLSLSFSSLSSSPSFFTLHHPAMHHSVLVIHLPFHLCFLLLRGGCDHRNILEGEEGAEWERLAEEQSRA